MKSLLHLLSIVLLSCTVLLETTNAHFFRISDSCRIHKSAKAVGLLRQHTCVQPLGRLPIHSNKVCHLLNHNIIRGGGETVSESEYDEEEEDYNNQEEDNNGEDNNPISASSESTITMIVNTFISTSKSMLNKIWEFLGAAEISDLEESPNLTGTPAAATTTTSTAPSFSMTDFGSYLSSAYQVEDGRKKATAQSLILGGSLSDALQRARSSARLLVVFIPSNKPSAKSAAAVVDRKVIQAFLSSNVQQIAQKKARKSSETASYLFWSAKVGSIEAMTAMKRLKVKDRNAKGQKRPILLVAYPAQTMTTKGSKITPKVLVQHHCSPPLSAEQMAHWMNDVRKRFSKQYIKMQTDLQEQSLYQERIQGYKSSIQSDTERNIQEQQQEAVRIAQEAVEQERQQQLQQRRITFLKNLPEPPGPDEGNNVMTISVRDLRGKSENRRFTLDTPLEMVFNWVDATFELERECIVLTTMNGKHSFTWHDNVQDQATTITLKETGLGRMVGFRVTEMMKEDGKEQVTEKNKDEISTTE